jgi:hypothetical protein
MNEAQFGNRIRHMLNQGLRLEEHTAARLRAAREAALARHRAGRAPALEWADNVLGRVGGLGGLSLRVLLPAAALVLAAAAFHTWQQNRLAAEIEELDAQLLTDELPIDAYLDRGFQNWLKKRAAEE